MMPRVLLDQLSESSLLETRNRIVFTSIDSTNEVGKSIIRNVLRAGDDLPSGILVALEQTAGRGRLGRRLRLGSGSLRGRRRGALLVRRQRGARQPFSALAC